MMSDQDKLPNDGNGFEELRRDVDAVERKMAREIEPGKRAVFMAVLFLALLASFSLPHTGNVRGWDVLAGASDLAANNVTFPSRLFVWFALIFGVFASMLALMTRRWGLAWIAFTGTAVSTVLGMLAIWSRQTIRADLAGGGPGYGLVIAWIAVGLLAFQWLNIVWSKSSILLAAEERRRQEEENEKNREKGDQ
ncbi:MAG: hypothetical protein LLG14_14070 [Nocardiaceae bacterium]|nr:hypothetical protein [Nocardiaceae bacterium]